MTRWFKHGAVLAAWLAFGAVALAQPGMYPSPVPVGATRILEPLRYTPDSPPPTNMVPGPINPAIAPAGPPESLNLPANHTNAFETDGYPPEEAYFASLGAMTLMRQGLARVPIAYTENISRGLDTGVIPLGRYPVLANANFVHPDHHLGWRATVGYLYHNEAYELTGFYLPDETNSAAIERQGQIFIPFTPVGVFPVGFEGNNGLWTQADRLEMTYRSAVGSAEANYRWWNIGLNHVELIVGLRYFHTQERLGIMVDDEFFVRDVFGVPDPRRRATYGVTTRNNFVGAQFGGEYSTPVLPIQGINWLWVTVMGKTSLGANFVERGWRLERGDGRVGFDYSQNNIVFGSVNEAAGFLDIHLMDRVRLRAGYTFIWAAGFTDPASQLDFNFQTQGQKANAHGSAYYHGVVGEVQFLF